MQNKGFRYIVWMYTSYVWYTTISNSVLPTHVFQQGLTIPQMMLGQAFRFLAQLTLLLFVNKYVAKKSWLSAVILVAASLLFVIHIQSVWQYYISVILSGLALGFFFVTYNIAHFKNTPKVQTGESSGIMFAIGPTIAIIAPLLAGFLATYAMRWLWIVSGISGLIAIYAISRQNNFVLHYKIRDAIRELEPTRIFILLEGIWEAVIMSIIPIYTLKYISSPLDYGKYIAYLSVAGVIAGFLLGKFTDKLRRRSVFLYPLTMSLAVLTVMLSFASGNAYSWIIVTGLIQFIIPTFWNITTAMIVDKHVSLEVAIPGREIILAVGRIVGLGIAYIGFQSGHIQETCLFLACVMILFPAILFWNTTLTKKYTYI